MARGRTGHFYIDQTCIGCGACEHACPGKVDAIHKLAGDFLGRFTIDPDDCIDCGFCAPLCPVACIHDGRAEGVATGPGGRMDVRELQAWATQARGRFPRGGPSSSAKSPPFEPGPAGPAREVEV